ncbi:uncharacterized protein LOC144355916 [Saccoglossus kowalevskii]
MHFVYSLVGSETVVLAQYANYLGHEESNETPGELLVEIKVICKTDLELDSRWQTVDGYGVFSGLLSFWSLDGRLVFFVESSMHSSLLSRPAVLDARSFVT